MANGFKPPSDLEQFAAGVGQSILAGQQRRQQQKQDEATRAAELEQQRLAGEQQLDLREEGLRRSIAFERQQKVDFLANSPSTRKFLTDTLQMDDNAIIETMTLDMMKEASTNIGQARMLAQNSFGKRALSEVQKRLGLGGDTPPDPTIDATQQAGLDAAAPGKSDTLGEVGARVFAGGGLAELGRSAEELRTQDEAPTPGPGADTGFAGQPTRVEATPIREPFRQVSTGLMASRAPNADPFDDVFGAFMAQAAGVPFRSAIQRETDRNNLRVSQLQAERAAFSNEILRGAITEMQSSPDGTISDKTSSIIAALEGGFQTRGEMDVQRAQAENARLQNQILQNQLQANVVSSEQGLKLNEIRQSLAAPGLTGAERSQLITQQDTILKQLRTEDEALTSEERAQKEGATLFSNQEPLNEMFNISLQGFSDLDLGQLDQGPNIRTLDTLIDEFVADARKIPIPDSHIGFFLRKRLKRFVEEGKDDIGAIQGLSSFLVASLVPGEQATAGDLKDELDEILDKIRRLEEAPKK